MAPRGINLLDASENATSYLPATGGGHGKGGGGHGGMEGGLGKLINLPCPLLFTEPADTQVCLPWLEYDLATQTGIWVSREG